MNSFDHRHTIPIAEAVILVVDDVAANRQVLSAVLRKAGYQVMSAMSAPHAMQQVNLQVRQPLFTTICRQIRTPRDRGPGTSLLDGAWVQRGARAAPYIRGRLDALAGCG